MKAIILAAGGSTRLRPLSEEVPKCMLEISGKSLLQNILELFRNNGIDDLSVVVGYKKEKIKMSYQDVTYFDNDDFKINAILHGLMYARAKFEEALKRGEDVIVTYSDIWYCDSVVKSLLKSKKAIAAIVDTDWRDYYEGRTEHPISEAENVIMDDNKRILKIGKHIFPEGVEKNKQGEFIGLWKLTPKGIKIFLKHFDRLNYTLKKTDPYQHAREWQKSYLTDILQEMIDQGEKIHGVLIQKSWMEFDTVQDYNRIKQE